MERPGRLAPPLSCTPTTARILSSPATRCRVIAPVVAERATTAAEPYDVAMAGWDDRGERQRVRAALVRGEPIAGGDHDTVGLVLDQVGWHRPLACCLAVLGPLWLYGPDFGHVSSRWAGVVWMLAMAVLTWAFLRQLPRIVDGATTRGSRREG